MIPKRRLGFWREGRVEMERRLGVERSLDRLTRYVSVLCLLSERFDLLETARDSLYFETKAYFIQG